MGQPLRFGIIRNNILGWDETLAQWQRFEDAGFDSVWNCDHLMRPSDPGGPHTDSWMVLAAVAARTKRLRIGVLVSCNTFRHPALLAKQAVTVDHISGGRLELGIGAGWFRLEHDAYGIPFPPAGELVDRFEEAVELINLLMTQDVSSYAGKYYQLNDAPFRPGPIQKPRPPFTLGAHGPRMLRLVAKHADRWNSYGSVDELRERNEAIDRNCAAIGRDPSTIIRSLYGWPKIIGADPWASPEVFSEVVANYRAAGINEFIFEPPVGDQWETMDRVCADLIPALRAETS